MTGDSERHREEVDPEDPLTGTTTDRPWERTDPDWPVHDTEIVWETPYFEAGYDVVERPSGQRGNYYWLDAADAAIVVALTADDEVVVVDQYRPRHRTTVRSLPAGAIEEGEDPTDGARRELREETGYVAGTLSHLDSYAPSMYERLVRHAYVARDLDPGDRDLDDSEFLAVETVPADEVIDDIRSRPGHPFGGALTPLLLAREEGVL